MYVSSPIHHPSRNTRKPHNQTIPPSPSQMMSNIVPKYLIRKSRLRLPPIDGGGEPKTQFELSLGKTLFRVFSFSRLSSAASSRQEREYTRLNLLHRHMRIRAFSCDGLLAVVGAVVLITGFLKEKRRR